MARVTLIDRIPRKTSIDTTSDPVASTVLASMPPREPAGGLVDPFGRTVTYLRLSVTDRCDLRCTYCMAEDMSFLPKAEVLSVDELERLTLAFIARGVRKVRLTGGEPLVRRGIVDLIRSLGRRLGNGLDELTLTTNGTQLARHAEDLARAGVRRVNVSLDTLDPHAYARLTRGGRIGRVVEGIAAGQSAGLRVKINAVLLRDNASDLPTLIAWAHGCDLDVTVIEAMPLGKIEGDRFAQHVSLERFRADLEREWTLSSLPLRTGGPARYVTVAETGGRLGFITPLSHNFCEACNRVRVTCTGRLYLCLGHEDGTDLRAMLRNHPDDDGPLHAALDAAIRRKPKGHDFRMDRAGLDPATPRHMSVTGG